MTRAWLASPSIRPACADLLARGAQASTADRSGVIGGRVMYRATIPGVVAFAGIAMQLSCLSGIGECLALKDFA